MSHSFRIILLSLTSADTINLQCLTQCHHIHVHSTVTRGSKQDLFTALITCFLKTSPVFVSSRIGVIQKKRKGGLNLVERSLVICKHQLLRPFSFGVKWLLVEPRDTNKSQKTLNLQMDFHYNFIDCDSVIQQYKPPLPVPLTLIQFPLKSRVAVN